MVNTSAGDGIFVVFICWIAFEGDDVSFSCYSTWEVISCSRRIKAVSKIPDFVLGNNALHEGAANQITV